MGRKSKAGGGVVADDHEEEDKNQFDQNGKFSNDIKYSIINRFLI
jgi:hypothetical protein